MNCAALRETRLTELAGLRKSGRKILGYSSHLVPVEIIRAVGGIPVRLMRGGYPAETAGLRFLRPDACPHCLSSLGNFALSAPDSFYPLVDAFVSVNTCDLARRLPESIRVHFRLPTFELYLPRTSEPFPHRLAEFGRQLGWLGHELAAFCGTQFDLARLAEAIRQEEALRAALRRFEQEHAPAESEVLDLVTLATTLDPETFLRHHRSYGTNRTYRPDCNRPRLMLVGSELAEDDRWLVRVVEEQADIVADLVSEGRAWYADSCPQRGEPLADLASFCYFRQPAVFRRPNDYTYERIRELALRAGVQGIVLKTLLFCDAWNLETERMRAALGLPLLHLESNYAPEHREQMRTRVEAFLESLEPSTP